SRQARPFCSELQRSSTLSYTTHPATTQNYTLSLHDALPISSIDVKLTKEATRDQFKDIVRSYSKKLQPGDLFLLTYSGHGGQLPDLNNDEADAIDETWCMYDGQIADDEIYRSEEHTSELQSRENLVCRLLLEKKQHPHIQDI